MDFKLNFNMDNVAFGDPPNNHIEMIFEIERILSNVIKKVGHGYLAEESIKDSNGNIIGSWEIGND